MHSVEYTAHAIKDLNKLPSEVKTKIFTGIGKIKEDRVIMAIKEPLLIIQVMEVGNRSEIYRNY